MTLRTVVVLVVLALVAKRLFPRRQVPWALPLVLGVVILVVRGVAYVVTDA